MNFDKRVSVIVPVYNVEKYLEECIGSLLNQSMDNDDLEIILVNDGSTDGSLGICKKYAELYPCITLFSKENEGLSATRNYAIKRAKGKYFTFLDSDDTFSYDTLEKVCNFFDAHYDEVDLVTYKIQEYKDGKKKALHFRYKYLVDSGIYDLNCFPYITQTNINVFVKNLNENNVLFDTTPHFRQEDQAYNSEILSRKMKIGFCAEGEYQYNRDNDTSITASVFNPIEMFEATMEYFEKLFGSFGDNVPKYYQSMYFHDLQWKLRSNVLYPYHYDKEQLEEARRRINRLLEYVSVDIIINHPDVDNYHKYYWLTQKENSNVVFVGDKKDVMLAANGEIIYSRPRIELVFYRIKNIDGNIKILLSAKSPIFSFTNEPIIKALINDNIEQIQQIYPSSYDYYHCKERTNRFWTFTFEYDVEKLNTLKFIVNIEGIDYDVNYYFMPQCPFDSKLEIENCIRDNICISISNNKLLFRCVNSEGKKKILEDNSIKYKKAFPQNASERSSIVGFLKKRPIWLYYDCRGVEYDNAYLQFKHDLKLDDGIERYYVSANPYKQQKEIFEDNELKYVITFGSVLHKILFANADKIITAYIEDINVSPFESKIPIVNDICNAEVIYLQHGVLHATLPWKYSPERINIDKVVVSSNFEKDNFTKKYGFREKDLIEAGMPRLEKLNVNAKCNNRILFAPSWRSYLTSQNVDGTWTININNFTSSEYFKKFNDFLSSKELNDLLSENDMYLDFKLHPIFKNFADCFNVFGDHINMFDGQHEDKDYKIFITDFSSYVFNFAYLKRPILYFVPDMMQFKAGLNSYRELDMPFEEAFGEVVETSDTAITKIKKMIANEDNINDFYEKRMNKFFIDFENSTDIIYEKVKCVDGVVV